MDLLAKSKEYFEGNTDVDALFMTADGLAFRTGADAAAHANQLGSVQITTVTRQQAETYSGIEQRIVQPEGGGLAETGLNSPSGKPLMTAAERAATPDPQEQSAEVSTGGAVDAAQPQTLSNPDGLSEAEKAAEADKSAKLNGRATKK